MVVEATPEEAATDATAGPEEPVVPEEMFTTEPEEPTSEPTPWEPPEWVGDRSGEEPAVVGGTSAPFQGAEEPTMAAASVEVPEARTTPHATVWEEPTDLGAEPWSESAAADDAPEPEVDLLDPRSVGEPPRTGRWLLVTVLGALALAWLFPLAVAALRELVAL